MDVKRIPRIRPGAGTEKRVRIALHGRLMEYGEKTGDTDLTSVMTAVKWIGNAGSHTGDMTIDDLHDGFELLEHVLNRMFDRSAEELAKLSRRINKRKGPAGRRRK